MENQSRLIQQLENENGNSWLIILDAGRPDVFHDIHNRYISGDLQKVYNGGALDTSTWFKDMFSRNIEGHLFHGGAPIVGLNNPVVYDERRYFKHVPSAHLYDAYGEESNFGTTPPSSVNDVVEMHMPGDSIVSDRLKALGYVPSGKETPGFDMNIVRYLQPHLPYRKIDDMVDQRQEIKKRVNSGELSLEQVRDLYVDNYMWALEYVAKLLDIIEPVADNVIVSADHGECLGDCGEWFHGTTNHHHLVHVPWLRVK